MSGADDDARRIDLGELIEHVKEKRTAANWRQGLGNPSELELTIAAREQRKITRLRLERLLQ